MSKSLSRSKNRRNFLAEESDDSDDSSDVSEAEESSAEESDDDSQSKTRRSRATPAKRKRKSDSRGEPEKSKGNQTLSQVVLHFTEDDEKKYTADLVFFILVQEQKRLPLKKGDAFKATNMTGKPRDFQDRVWNKTVSKLKHAFGIDVKELPDKKGVYLLINRLRNSVNVNHHFTECSDLESANLGLLFVVLSLIFMNNGVMKDEELFNFLQKMGVYDGRRQTKGARETGGVAKDIRELFGDVHNLIFKEWAQKQLYLDITKLDTGETDNPRFEIRWGPRANMEIKKSDVLKTVCTLYNVEPKAFKNEYDKVLNEEGAEVLAALRINDDDDDN